MAHKQTTKMYLQELCVYGFIRMQCISDIPDALIQIILSMYLMVFDEWNKELSNKWWRIDNKTGQIIANGNSVDKYEEREWKHAFGSFIIKKGEINVWKLRITNKNPRNGANRAVFVGIINAEQNESHIKRYFCAHSMNNSVIGYGFYSYSGRKESSREVNKYRYKIGGYGGYAWDRNDIVTMTLDMTGTKYASLSFKVNDKDFGVAFQEIDINLEYRMVIAVYYEDDIQLLYE